MCLLSDLSRVGIYAHVAEFKTWRIWGPNRVYGGLGDFAVPGCQVHGFRFRTGFSLEFRKKVSI